MPNVPTISRKPAGHHERQVRGETNEWYTPPEIVSALGPFDLDPCSPVDRNWDTAANHFNRIDDGLSHEWFGRVWMNPPYGPDVADWLERMASHGNGVALIFARVETKWFHRHVWSRADALLFPVGRIRFLRPDGKPADSPPDPSVFVAYGQDNVAALYRSGITGRIVSLKHSTALQP